MDEETFRRGIDLFNRREFFECHELLEEIWTPSRGPERLFLQALIHFAVGFYHQQRRNPVGAERQLRKGLRKVQGYLPRYAGVDTFALREEVTQFLAGDHQDKFPCIHREESTPPRR
jgi:hypothetical protein